MYNARTLQLESELEKRQNAEGVCMSKCIGLWMWGGDILAEELCLLQLFFFKDVMSHTLQIKFKPKRNNNCAKYQSQMQIHIFEQLSCNIIILLLIYGYKTISPGPADSTH